MNGKGKAGRVLCLTAFSCGRKRSDAVMAWPVRAWFMFLRQGWGAYNEWQRPRSQTCASQAKLTPANLLVLVMDLSNKGSSSSREAMGLKLHTYRY